MAVGQGSIQVNQARTPPAAAPTVTGADNGVSLNGTIVEFGDTSSSGILSQLTNNRFLNLNGNNINFDSNAAANPNNTVKLDFASIGGIAISRLQAAGVQPKLQINDTIVTASSNVLTNKSIAITGSATAIPFLTINGPSASETITGTAAAKPGLLLNATGAAETNTQTNQNIILANFAGPGFVMSGTNAAGSVFASQFTNSSIAAAASVLSQWYVDNSVQDFEIVKYSNANAGSGNPGGVDFVHNNSAVPTALLRLMASSPTAAIRATIGGGGAIFLNLDRAGGTYTIGDVNSVVNATTVSAEDVSSLVRIKGNNGLIIQSVAGIRWVQVSSSGLELGNAGSNIGRLLFDGNTSGTITLQPQAAAGTFTLTLPNTAGTALQFLQTDGAGNLSWAGSNNGQTQLAPVTVNTVDATPTTVLTIPIPTGKTIQVFFTYTLRNTSANTGKGAMFSFAAKEVAGVYSNVGSPFGATAMPLQDAGLATALPASAISGSNLLVQVTGIVATNISWNITSIYTATSP